MKTGESIEKTVEKIEKKGYKVTFAASENLVFAENDNIKIKSENITQLYKLIEIVEGDKKQAKAFIKLKKDVESFKKKYPEEDTGPFDDFISAVEIIEDKQRMLQDSITK